LNKGRSKQKGLFHDRNRLELTIAALTDRLRDTTPRDVLDRWLLRGSDRDGQDELVECLREMQGPTFPELRLVFPGIVALYVRECCVVTGRFPSASEVAKRGSLGANTPRRYYESFAHACEWESWPKETGRGRPRWSLRAGIAIVAVVFVGTAVVLGARVFRPAPEEGLRRLLLQKYLVASRDEILYLTQILEPPRAAAVLRGPAGHRAVLFDGETRRLIEVAWRDIPFGAATHTGSYEVAPAYRRGFALWFSHRAPRLIACLRDNQLFPTVVAAYDANDLTLPPRRYWHPGHITWIDEDIDGNLLFVGVNNRLYKTLTPGEPRHFPVIGLLRVGASMVGLGPMEVPHASGRELWYSYATSARLRFTVQAYDAGSREIDVVAESSAEDRADVQARGGRAACALYLKLRYSRREIVEVNREIQNDRPCEAVDAKLASIASTPPPL